MKKYFLYELKKARWQLIIISAICTILFGTIAAVMPNSLSYSVEGTPSAITNPPLIGGIGGAMTLMCFIAPVLVYAFKMNKRCVDCYYALPLKKTKLYFVKTIIGLLLVLVPFTMAYWVTFLIYLIRPNNPYDMVWFVPTYFGLLFFGICLFGYNAFAFTRANSVADGVVFMIGYQAVMILVALIPFIWSSGKLISVRYLLDFVPEWGASIFTSNMEALVCESQLSQTILSQLGLKMTAMTFIMPLLRGAAGYGLMFFLLKYDKAEASQQVCESWFGYKTLIPIFAGTIIGLLVGTIAQLSLSVAVVIFVMFSVLAFVLTIVWRRKFVFGKTGWTVFGVSLGAGLLIAVVTALIL